MASTNGTSGTPEALAKDIEQTREDLAQTLDAIAEKVSPKRVAKRTTKKAADSVKVTAAAAKDAVLSGAATAKEAVVSGAETAKEKVTGAPCAAEVQTSVPAVVEDEAGPDVAALPPVEGVAVPLLSTRPGAATRAAPLRTTGPVHRPALPGGVKKEYVAAAAVLVAMALLVRHQRGR